MDHNQEIHCVCSKTHSTELKEANPVCYRAQEFRFSPFAHNGSVAMFYTEEIIGNQPDC